MQLDANYVFVSAQKQPKWQNVNIEKAVRNGKVYDYVFLCKFVE